MDDLFLYIMLGGFSCIGIIPVYMFNYLRKGELENFFSFWKKNFYNSSLTGILIILIIFLCFFRFR